jgi:hypothetical protein
MSFKNLGESFNPNKGETQQINLSDFDNYETYYDKVKDKIDDDYRLVGLSKSNDQCWDNHDLLQFEKFNFSCSQKGFLVKSDSKCPEDHASSSKKYTEDDKYGQIWPVQFNVGNERSQDAWYVDSINDFFNFDTLYFESIFIGDYLFGSLYELAFLGSNQNKTFSEDYEQQGSSFHGELHTLTDEYLDVSEDAPLLIGYDKNQSDFEPVVFIDGNKITSKVPVIFSKDSAPFYFENATTTSNRPSEFSPISFSCNMQDSQDPVPPVSPSVTPTITPSNSGPNISATLTPTPTATLMATPTPTRTPRPPRFTN